MGKRQLSRKFKILGAGSIGNHLANAARAIGWQVALCDVDPAALERARDEIYPQRYGSWDPEIELYQVADAPRSVHDVIAIGTPPDIHVALGIDAIAERPRAVLIEKPVCGPDLARADELYNLARELDVSVFVGYDHVVGQAASEMTEAASALDHIETIDVEFREHWAGIFAAHPWLEGPQDSYLGFWQRGGGASGEHSHAINLWQHMARSVGAGNVLEVSATMEYVRDDGVDYDKLCLLNLRTESGLIGRVVQDVVTLPPRKWARVQARNGYVEMTIGIQPGADSVTTKIGDAPPEQSLIEKTRPDDFIRELEHIDSVLTGKLKASPISIEAGLDTMLVVAAAHRSAHEGRTIHIDRSQGYSPAALTTG